MPLLQLLTAAMALAIPDGESGLEVQDEMQ